MTARAMSDEEIDAAIIAACNMTHMQGPLRLSAQPLHRAIWRAAAERCAVACEGRANLAVDERRHDDVREAESCAAACRKVGEA